MFVKSIQDASYESKIDDVKPEFPDDFPSELSGLIDSGWSKDPKSRPTIPEFKSVIFELRDDENPSDELQVLRDEANYSGKKFSQKL